MTYHVLRGEGDLGDALDAGQARLVRHDHDGRPAPVGARAGGGEDARAKMRELSATRDKDLAAVLTSDQSAQFEKMKGKEFDVAALRGGFGGPGGPGGGGPGAGGRPGGGRPGAEGRPKTQAP
mgnify:CR=1 FL=1